RRVEDFVRGRQNRAARARRQDRLELLPIRNPAAVLEDQLAEGDAKWQLVVSWLGDVPAQAEDLDTAALRRADRLVRVRAVAHNPRHIRQRLDVVDHGRRIVQAAALLRGERRADARLAEQPLQAVEQRAFLAADVRARAQVDVYRAAPPAAEDVLSGEIVLLRDLNLLFERVRQIPELTTAIDVDGGRLDRIGGDQRALDHLMRVLLKKLAIFERAGLAFVRVDGDVLNRRILRDKAPLAPGRKARPAPAAQVGVQHNLDHLGGRVFLNGFL